MDFVLSLFFLLLRNVLGNLDLVVMLSAYYLMAHLVKRRAANQGLDAQKVADLSFWLAVGTLAGGRLAYALPHFQNYLSHPLDLLQFNTGMYFYGALAGGLVVGAWYTWRKKLPFWSTADMYGLYIPLAIALTRFGCLVENACYGRQASPPLGVLFPGLTQHRYPSELYEGLLALVLFGVLLWLSQKASVRGLVFLTFATGYPLARAVTDLTRIDLSGQLASMDPIVSLGVAAAMLAILVVMVKRGRNTARPANDAHHAGKEALGCGQ